MKLLRLRGGLRLEDAQEKRKGGQIHIYAWDCICSPIQPYLDPAHAVVAAAGHHTRVNGSGLERLEGGNFLLLQRVEWGGHGRGEETSGEASGGSGIPRDN